MTRTKFPKVPAKKPSPRVARPTSAKPPLRAHPRLIHGFLVRLATKAPVAAKAARSPFPAEANVKALAQSASDTKREGPADDATFH